LPYDLQQKYTLFLGLVKHYFGGKMDAKRLGKKIKIARIELDMNQTDLADKIGAKQKSISRYETGLSIPSIETLMKISKVLKKPAAYFLEG